LTDRLGHFVKHAEKGADCSLEPVRREISAVQFQGYLGVYIGLRRQTTASSCHSF
jgi:hypothetical protein